MTVEEKADQFDKLVQWLEIEVSESNSNFLLLKVIIDKIHKERRLAIKEYSNMEIEKLKSLEFNTNYYGQDVSDNNFPAVEIIKYNWNNIKNIEHLKYMLKRKGLWLTDKEDFADGIIDIISRSCGEKTIDSIIMQLKTHCDVLGLKPEIKLLNK